MEGAITPMPQHKLDVQLLLRFLLLGGLLRPFSKQFE